MSRRRGPRAPTPLVVALWLTTIVGCSPGSEPGPTAASPDQPASVLSVEVSNSRARPGERVTVTLRPAPSEPVPIGLAGRLRYDPSRLSFVGQPAPSAPFTIVNHQDRAELRLAMLEPSGLAGSTSKLVFEVLAPGYLDGLRFVVDESVDGSLASSGAWVTRVEVGAGDPTPEARLLDLTDWLTWARSRWARPVGGPSLAPGDGLVYGDLDLDGAITIFDAFGAANVGVGNLAMTDAVRDFVVAANVVPFNLPGLGEAADPLPPGVEPDGSRVVNIFDAAAISTEAVNCGTYPIGSCPGGQSGNLPVVGEPIPGRVAATERVVVTGDITAGRRFTADTIYELQGMVRVPFGVTLTIDPGTRVEGAPTSRGSLLVARGGRLVASGTMLEPIVFTCADPAPTPACWGGIVVDGFALLNTPYSGPGPVPACPERTVPGTTEIYGGCLVQDDSGTLEFVRIEYAGQPWPGLGAQPALSLNGVGSGTTLRSIQVLGSSGDGILVSGGHAALREVLVTHALADGLRWDDGWQGKGQNIVVFRTAGAGSGLHGSNSTVDPDAGPRSAPTLYQVSLLEPAGVSVGSAPAILFERGSAGILRDLIVLGWTGIGLEIDGPESCARMVDSLDVAAGVWWANTADFSADADCADEVAFGTDPLRDNLSGDPLIGDLGTLASPDFRPQLGSIATTGLSPPGDGFFDPSLLHRGGAPIAVASGAIVPWFVGWTAGI